MHDSSRLILAILPATPISPGGSGLATFASGDEIVVVNAWDAPTPAGGPCFVLADESGSYIAVSWAC